MFGKPSGSQKGDKGKTKSEQEKRSMPDKDEEFKGLCMNCAKRHDCLFPKSEGGVWHCEEYLEDS